MITQSAMQVQFLRVSFFETGDCKTMSKTKTKLRVFEYPVNALHSSVLGYSATSKFGKRCWDELDWSGVFPDGGQHLFNPSGGEYLHVRVKYDPDQDGGLPCPLSDRRKYRVRCWHEIDTKWRGGVVSDVKVEKRNRSQKVVQWVWVVIVDGETR